MRTNRLQTVYMLWWLPLRVSIGGWVSQVHVWSGGWVHTPNPPLHIPTPDMPTPDLHIPTPFPRHAHSRTYPSPDIPNPLAWTDPPFLDIHTPFPWTDPPPKMDMGPSIHTQPRRDGKYLTNFIGQFCVASAVSPWAPTPQWRKCNLCQGNNFNAQQKSQWVTSLFGNNIVMILTHTIGRGNGSFPVLLPIIKTKILLK